MFFSRKEPKGRGIFDIPIAPEEVIRTSFVKFSIAEICKVWLSAKLKVLNTPIDPCGYKVIVLFKGNVRKGIKGLFFATLRRQSFVIYRMILNCIMGYF